MLASHMFSVCCGELGDTKAELLNFTLPCSGDYVWVRKVRIVCILSLGCWFEDIDFSKCCHSENLLSFHYVLKTF